MKRKTKHKIKIIPVLFILLIVVAAVVLTVRFSEKFRTSANTPAPAQTETATSIPTQSPDGIPSPEPQATETPAPQESQAPAQQLVIRTDYEAFKPNESGDIPVVMFHRFVEDYDGDTVYTTTFKEFEELLETLYNQGFRLISMQDFIDCNISVPAGTMPMVFTFDDGTSGQFSLIEENGELKVNPKSAAGIMLAFHEKHPDFGLKGIFYVNMDIGDNTFKGAGTLRERFEILESLGFEIGTHTWGHVDYTTVTSGDKVQESLGKNQQKAEEILPGLRFYSLALPYGSRPKDKSLWPLLQKGTYEGLPYYHESIMAVGAEPSAPSISKKYDSSYVHRIRSQGKDPVDCDLTWWLPKMTSSRMFVSDGDPETIVVPADKAEKIDMDKLGSKKLVTY